MSQQRLERLERLERRQPHGKPWVDPFDTAAALLAEFEAVAAGRACWIERPTPERSPEVEQLVALRLRESNTIAVRLAAEAPL
jgi:hypothetical protein